MTYKIIGSIVVDWFVVCFLQIVPFYGVVQVHSGTIVAKIQKKEVGNLEGNNRIKALTCTGAYSKE